MVGLVWTDVSDRCLWEIPYLAGRWRGIRAATSVYGCAGYSYAAGRK